MSRHDHWAVERQRADEIHSIVFATGPSEHEGVIEPSTEPKNLGEELLELISNRERIHTAESGGILLLWDEAAMSFIDLPLPNYKYSWSDLRDNPTLSRLDRVIVNERWLDLFPHQKLNGLQRPTSDHKTTERSAPDRGLNKIEASAIKPFSLYLTASLATSDSTPGVTEGTLRLMSMLPGDGRLVLVKSIVY
ncbi:hypothetical protein FRX31_020365 [Thalictrum thalictroides]|nr:hypothetical protein FRX31_020365 [Thalictrum thalictroides]